MASERSESEPSSKVAFAMRMQDFFDHKDAIYGTLNLIRQEKPDATHLLWTGATTPGYTSMIPFDRIEGIFERAELSFHLAAIDQGFDIGINALMRSCQPVEKTPESP